MKKKEKTRTPAAGERHLLKRKPKRFAVKHWQSVAFLLMFYDLIAVNGAYFTALWIRHDFRISAISPVYFAAWLKFLPIYTVFCFVIFFYFRLYRSIWRFASYNELTRVLAASFIASAFHTVFITLLSGRMPISYYVLGAGIQFGLILGVRFSYRFVLLIKNRQLKEQQKANASRIMLIGAGSAGQMILRDLQNAKKLNQRVCCIIDDNSNKWGRYIDDVPIVGGRESIIENVEKYGIEKIYFAIPSADERERGKILNICKETGCELKRLPGMYQLVSGEVSVSTLRDVKIEDLLGREPVEVNMNEIFDFITGKVILVTGGGGSIGSEICRQTALHAPKRLIIFDVYENNAHAIALELTDKHPNLNLTVLIGSVRDSARINSVFETYKPDIVYHAAAHKHVPLMEFNPCEAIKNNVLGTYKTAYAAMMNGCKRFVLISTDKAVNPTNVMGASKRVCEMIIQSFDRKIKERKITDLPILNTSENGVDKFIHDVSKNNAYPHTEFVAVRFGNVLGSNGSVIPRFKAQIAEGGPVTVTHPEIIRYFMTIPEAASLVLQAGTYAKGGEIFVLDMGEPVKIDTLARNLIKLSGLKPDEDIKIKYIGLRPGEKLYEEKLMADEGIKMTPNKLIYIGSPIPFDTDKFLRQLENLARAAYLNRENDIRNILEGVVSAYHPEDVGSTCATAQPNDADMTESGAENEALHAAAVM